MDTTTKQTTERNKHIFISAVDPSADAHCAGLIKAMHKKEPQTKFTGVGGAKMASAGCKLLEKTTDKSSMSYNSFAHIAHFYKLLRQIRRFFEDNPVDLVIVCDSPSFNFHVARAAKQAGIKTLFYVAPQLWAWGGWRIGKLRKCCDKLCCLLPFEQDWFVSRGVDAVFVGNPLFDDIDTDLRANIKDYTDFDPAKVRLALMPGSRTAEINTLWQPMQQVAVKIRQKYPQAEFVTVAADKDRVQTLKNNKIPGFDCDFSVDSVKKTACNVDFAIVASGSATLEVAASGCPMVIMYQANRVLWHLLGRWLIKSKFLSLVNLLADRELVPEFMPYFTSTEPIARAVEQLLSNSRDLTHISTQLVEMVEPMAQKNAGEQTAQIAHTMLSRNP